MVPASGDERVQLGAGTSGESPRQIHSVEMAAPTPGVALPVEGVILVLQPSCTRSLDSSICELTAWLKLMRPSTSS